MFPYARRLKSNPNYNLSHFVLCVLVTAHVIRSNSRCLCSNKIQKLNFKIQNNRVDFLCIGLPYIKYCIIRYNESVDVWIIILSSHC